jgi:hypothetical protein
VSTESNTKQKNAHRNREQLLSDQWKSAVSSGRDQLERDDLRQVLDFEDLQDQIQASRGDHSIHQEFAMLAHGLLKLRTFTDNWMRQVSSRVDASGFCGLLRLTLKVCHSPDLLSSEEVY